MILCVDSFFLFVAPVPPKALKFLVFIVYLAIFLYVLCHKNSKYTTNFTSCRMTSTIKKSVHTLIQHIKLHTHKHKKSMAYFWLLQTYNNRTENAHVPFGYRRCFLFFCPFHLKFFLSFFAFDFHRHSLYSFFVLFVCLFQLLGCILLYFWPLVDIFLLFSA